MKRTNYLDWQTEFMTLAFCISARSKDAHSVGCVAVDSNNKILSLGYNGFPVGISDDEFTWEKTDPNDNKYMYVVHAEENMIVNANKSLEGSTVYCTLSPCLHCIKLLIQSKIKKIVYYEHYDLEEQKFKNAGKKMLETVGIECVPFTGDKKIIESVKACLQI